MVYLSLALILLGIVIFLYSIILDTKKRRGGQVPPGFSDSPSRDTVGRMPRSSASAETGKASRQAGVRAKRSPADEQAAGPAPGRERHAGGSLEHQAVLFEDSSHVIDYGNETGSIDPSLKGYRNIKRIGSGRLAVEKGGVTFFMGKKLYRYDFHRVSDLKKGSTHLALFLHGSKAVRLFIVEPGSEIVNEANDAYREYMRSSA